jgi:hypothetical protein
MTKTLRQLAILAVLVVVAVVLWLRPGTNLPAASVAPASNSAGPGNAAPAPAMVVADLRLDRLAAEPVAVPAPARDPFRFRPAPPPPSPPPPPLPPAPPVETMPRTFVQPPPSVAPIPLRLIGVLERDAGPVAIFVDTPGEGRPLYGREGDVIAGRYRLLRVGSDAVDVAYLDGRGQQTIRMSRP